MPEIPEFQFTWPYIARLTKKNLNPAGAGRQPTSPFSPMTRAVRPTAPIPTGTWPTARRIPREITDRIRVAIPGTRSTERSPTRSKDRPLRFVIEAAAPIDTNTIENVVRRLMRVNDDTGSNTVGRNFKVEPLFRGADPTEQVFKLANFYLLILPLSLHLMMRRAKRRDGALYDLAYQLSS